MAGEIGLRVKKLIDESDKVLAAVAKADRRNLTKFGFETRKDAKKSIRKRKRVSQPGQPPRSVSGLLKRTIFYWVDASASVVVGPISLSNTRGIATGALEHGGQSINKQGHRVNIAARPFMQPAFNRTRQDIAKIWSNSVR